MPSQTATSLYPWVCIRRVRIGKEMVLRAVEQAGTTLIMMPLALTNHFEMMICAIVELARLPKKPKVMPAVMTGVTLCAIPIITGKTRVETPPTTTRSFVGAVAKILPMASDIINVPTETALNMMDILPMETPSSSHIGREKIDNTEKGNAFSAAMTAQPIPTDQILNCSFRDDILITFYNPFLLTGFKLSKYVVRVGRN